MKRKRERKKERKRSEVRGKRRDGNRNRVQIGEEKRGGGEWKEGIREKKGRARKNVFQSLA